MKAKYLIALQIVLLMAAAGAGYVLKGDLVGGPRMAHRLFGMSAAVVCIVTAAKLLSQKGRPSNVRTLALAAAAFSLLAGLAGKMVKSASNYSLVFNTMRGSATLALLASIGLLVALNNAPAKSKKPKSKK